MAKKPNPLHDNPRSREMSAPVDPEDLTDDAGDMSTDDSKFPSERLRKLSEDKRKKDKPKGDDK